MFSTLNKEIALSIARSFGLESEVRTLIDEWGFSPEDALNEFALS